MTHKILFLISILLTNFSYANQQAKTDNITTSYYFALRGEPKYTENFKHWDYVNPNAPKAGNITYSKIGSFNNFNNFAQRGVAPSLIKELLFDTLMVSNQDELLVYYPLIAKQVSYSDDYSWVIFDINENAKFHDGSSVTAQDVAFSYNLFFEQGGMQFKKLFDGVSVEVINSLKVKFTLANPDKALAVNLCSLTVLPQHYYQDIKFEEPFSTPPMTSGPYQVQSYEMGHYIVYQRNPDYWAAELPVNKGRFNFEQIRVEYYLDETVLMEAFKKGEFDLKQEKNSKNWRTQYAGEQFDTGQIIAEEIQHQIPSGNAAFIFNLNQPQFKNVKIRQALNLLFDFEWTNKNYFYGEYERNNSYFMNSKYGSSGLPQGKELAILKQFKNQLPEELFTAPFTVNQTDGTGNIRPELSKALKLFKQAGYQLKDNQLVNENGEQFTFELLIYKPSDERYSIAFQQNIARIGAEMKIKLVSDVAQYVNRVRTKDYDMIIQRFAGFPKEMIKFQWHSEQLDSHYNWVSANNPVVDQLVDGVIANLGNEEALVPYMRALDRVLLWNYYSIPQWHLSKYRVAYWNKFSRPQKLPKFGFGGLLSDTWWYDVQKASLLKSNQNNWLVKQTVSQIPEKQQ